MGTRLLREENRDVLRVRRRPNHVVQVGGWIFTSIHSRHSHIVRRVSPLPKRQTEALPEARREAQGDRRPPLGLKPRADFRDFTRR